MKKLTAVLLAAAMTLSMAACGAKEEPAAAGTDAAGAATTEAAAITSKADLEGKKIGVQSGTTGDSTVTEEFGEEAVERYNKGAEAVQALLQGKIDAVIIDDLPAQTFVEQNEGLKILDEVFVEEDYAIAVGKENTELKDELNKTLEALKADGTFDAIVAYYLNGEGEPYQVKEDVARDGKLVMATNAEFPPYEYYEGQDIVGIDADIARAMADAMGKELVIEDMAFDAIVAAVQSGKADMGFAGMTVNEERLLSVDFSDSYYTGRQVIIVRE